MSSFPGLIHEIPGIFVDNFENVNARAYFLSHCHTDHMQGLSRPGLINYLKKNNNVFIYTSLVSSIILEHTFGADVMKYVKVLTLGTSLVKLPCIPDTAMEELYINVTLIPAGHCLGAVMFLFRKPPKVILYTGDFRIDTNDVQKFKALHENDGQVIPIDTIYTDATFNDGAHKNFPRRKLSIEYTLKEVKDWLKNNIDGKVAIHTPAKYGYEFVFNELHRELDLKVYVDSERWKLYSKLKHLVPGVTNDPNECTVHLCSNRSETASHARCHTDHNETTKYLYIYFSAFKWKNYDHDENPIDNIKIDDRKCKRVDICFSTHCSENELNYFINYLHPKRVVTFQNGRTVSRELSPPKKIENLTGRFSRKRKIISSSSCSSSSTSSPDKKMYSKLLKDMFDIM